MSLLGAFSLGFGAGALLLAGLVRLIFEPRVYTTFSDDEVRRLAVLLATKTGKMVFINRKLDGGLSISGE